MNYWQQREDEDKAWWRSLSKNEWIAAARAKFNPGEPERCDICQKFGSIAQAHHIIPLTDQFDPGFVRPSQRFVWLCPNHHAMVHLFMGKSDFRIQGYVTLALTYYLARAEVDRIAALIEQSKKGAIL